MGRQFAYDLGSAAAGTRNLPQIRLRVAIEQHLRFNHYPPIPLAMGEPAEKAVEAYLDEDYERIIETPFAHKTFGCQMPANEIVKALSLDAFIDALRDADYSEIEVQQ